MKLWLQNNLSGNIKNNVIKLYKKYSYFKTLFYKYPKTDKTFNPIDKELFNSFNDKRYLGKKRFFCYVPFTNIFFNTSGFALSCCFNTKFILGSYPSNTLQEIWQSSSRKLLCEHMKHNDLSMGCEYCHYLIKTGKTTNIKVGVNDLYATSNFNKYPKILEFELSNQCNLECIMCSGRVSSSIRKNREKLTPLINPYDDNFVEQLIPFIKNASEAKFFGGEPFLINIYYKIWDEIIRIKPSLKVYILSNGTIFNDKILNYIEKGNFQLSFSIDSLTKETYEKIRKNANFEEVIHNIEKYYQILQKKNKYIGLSITPMKENWKEIPDLIRYANRMQATVYTSFVEYPTNLALWSFEINELIKIAEFYKTQKFIASSNIELQNINCFNDLISQIDWWIANDKDKTNPARFNKNIEISNDAYKYIDFEEVKTILFNKIHRFLQTQSDNKQYPLNLHKVITEKIDDALLLLDEQKKQEVLIKLENVEITAMVINELKTGNAYDLLAKLKIYLLDNNAN